MTPTAITKYRESVLQGSADDLPCACGERKHARPQIPIGDMQTEIRGQTMRCSRDFRCGVCGQIHKCAAAMIYLGSES